jgi:hypothetical protein
MAVPKKNIEDFFNPRVVDKEKYISEDINYLKDIINKKAGVIDMMSPGPLKDELRGTYDPTQESYEEFLQRQSIPQMDRPLTGQAPSDAILETQRIDLNEGGVLGPGGMFRGEDLGTREGFKSIEPNINERFNPVTKKPIGYVVSSRITGDSKYFGFENYGTKEDALKAAQAFKKENLKNVLTDDQYLKLRKQNLDKTAREFVGSLDNYVTLKGKKWTRDLVKNKDRQVKIKSPHKYEKLIVDPKIKNEIYEKYLNKVAEGQREGSLVGLGREYFPGRSSDSQNKIIRKILQEKGEDVSQYKKTGTGEKFATQKVRLEKLKQGAKLAGSKAKYLSDEIILDIKAMNKEVADMPLEIIAKNKKYIDSMRVNATMENLSKGQIPFDKYSELSDLQLAEKIKDRAKANKFFDVEHISSVRGQKRNIYYPNNIQMAPGQFGSLMENFKRIAREQPDNPVLSKVDKVLSDYNLTVRDPVSKVRLGNKAVIEIADGVSNIVKSNFEALGTPFKKQIVSKPAKARGLSGPTLGMNLGLGKKLLTALQVLGTPAAALAFAGSEIKRGLDEGKTPFEATTDPNVGLSLLAPGVASRLNPGLLKGVLGLGKAARFFTPTGLALLTAGQAKDFYDQYQNLQALKETDPQAYEAFMSQRVSEEISPEQQTEIEEMGREGAMKGGIMRLGFKGGPKDPSKRKFIKVGAGILGALPFGVTKLFKSPTVQKGMEAAAPAAEAGWSWIKNNFWEVVGTVKNKAKTFAKLKDGEVRIHKDMEVIENPETIRVRYKTDNDNMAETVYTKPYKEVNPETGEIIDIPGDFQEYQDVYRLGNKEVYKDFEEEIIDSVENVKKIIKEN